jgi:hypothetical protein
MRRRLYWWTAVLIVAVGFGCSGNESEPGDPGNPTLDGSTWNGDGSFVDVMTDSDGDGVTDLVERASGDVDTDGDGIPDYQDADDDGDGIATKDERDLDSDNDGASNYIDADDDGDGIATKDELAAAGGKTKDSDGDGIPDYLDDDRLVDQDAGTVKECAQSSAKADLRKKPVDIVFVIDNSSSMSNEAKAVGQSINADFAKVIGMSGIDYRVIMLADFGHYDSASTDAHSICVNGELNPGQTCPAANTDAVYGKAPVNSARFFHYDPDGAAHNKDTSVGSRNSMCRALEWFNKADGFALAPNGWSKWLRKDASKVFVEITDDRVDCSVSLNGQTFTVKDSPMAAPADPNAAAIDSANKFDAALRGLSAEMFGANATARNYVFHSIISMPYKAGAMHDSPYESSEPIAGANCTGGENPGRGYEAMSRMTGGLRYPICAADDAAASGTAGFTAIFKKIAQGVVEGTKVACDFAVPVAPDGKMLDRETVEVVYSQTGADPISFRRVQDVESCSGQSGSFFFRGETIQLCSDTCTRVQADSTAKVDVRFGCTLPPRKEPPALPPPPVPE